MEDGVVLLVTLFMMPIVGFAVIWIIGQMLNNAISFLTGVVAIFLLMTGAAVGLVLHDLTIMGGYLFVLITLMCFFPYATEQLEKMEMRLIDVEGLDRAHEALSARPDNVAARFAMAKALYAIGFHGHAISLAESSLHELSTQYDNVKNASVRDMFRVEDGMVKQWKRNAIPGADRPVPCPFCGALNDTTRIACTGCGKAYLLERARNLDIRSRFFGKLVLGWAVLSSLLMLIFTTVSRTSGGVQMGLVAAEIAGVGLIMGLLFRKPPLRST